MYSVGNKLRMSLFGKSHAPCVGCILEGLPKGFRIDGEHLRRKMELRRPKNGIGTARREDDEVIIETGVRDWVITGDSITLYIANKDARPSDYSEFGTRPRPGHADLPALMSHKDYDISGGGPFSGRMTAPIVAAGAIAEQFLASKGIRVAAYTKAIGSVSDGAERTFSEIEGSARYATRAASEDLDIRMSECIMKAAGDRDSVGGIVGCMVTGLPAGFGGIWFDALDSSIARSIMSIPGAKGIEFGKGFSLSSMRGSESNDQYRVSGKDIVSDTNNMGGICGGMSNGMPLTFSTVFKPTPSIGREQRTVDLSTMTDTVITCGGRHDPCIVPRAVSAVEAMTALTVADQLLTFSEE